MGIQCADICKDLHFNAPKESLRSLPLRELFWGEDMLYDRPMLPCTTIISIEMYLTVGRRFLTEQDGSLELYEKLSSRGGTEIDDVHATIARSSRYDILQ